MSVENPSAWSAWAEIDLKAIAHNTRALRKITSKAARMMAVVKADGYGHGAAKVAEIALNHGADRLGVSRLHEGVALREAGIEAPILVFGYTPPAFAGHLLQWDLTQSVSSLETAEAYAGVGRAHRHPLKIHMKIDTGMGRLGCPVSSHPEGRAPAVREILAVSRLKGVEMEGIFSHFAAADAPDPSFSHMQFERFNEVIQRLEKDGCHIPLRHIANSAGIIQLPETHLDLVRAGISLYGLYPSEDVDQTRVHLRPAMTLKSRVIQLKKVPEGFPVSYGMTYVTPKPTTLATVAVGYADGVNRRLSSRGYMLVRGRRAPIVGRVCMDLTLLDVGRIPDVAIEDEVVVFGAQKESRIRVEELADLLQTISYEIVAALPARVKRIHLS